MQEVIIRKKDFIFYSTSERDYGFTTYFLSCTLLGYKIPISSFWCKSEGKDKKQALNEWWECFNGIHPYIGITRKEYYLKEIEKLLGIKIIDKIKNNSK